MLRLSGTNEEEGQLTILVEGRIISPWLEVLEAECRRELATGFAITLDLVGVTYVGPAGVTLLRQLTGEGVRLANASGVVAEMLATSD